MKYENILKHIGVLGKFQKILIAGFLLFQLPACCQFIGQVFLGATTDHWCKTPGIADVEANCSSSLGFENALECQEAQKNRSIPYELDSDGNLVFSSCKRYAEGEGGSDVNSSASSDVIISCDSGWNFDRSQYKSTINQDFSLVCEREDLPGVAQSVWFAGLLTGSIIWGSVGDWIGRRKTFFLSLVGVSISSIATSFSPSFEVFTLLRFVTANCCYGAFLMTYVLGSELVGPKQRVMYGSVSAMAFSVGYMVLVCLAYLIRDWRDLQLTMSLPFLPFFILFFWFPESPRWLISKGRFGEAKKILERIARVNKTQVPENLFDEGEENTKVPHGQTEEKVTTRPITQLDLLRTPNLRKKSLIICYDWFVVNMVYYGLSLSTSALGINDYVAGFVSGGVEIPGILLSWWMVDRYGRRFTTSSAYTTSGVACLITMCIPPGVARAVVAMVGKFAAAAAFNLVYLYSVEIYPTVTRTMGMGMSSMVARVSGILAPIILILGKYWHPLPLFVFGGSSVLAGLFTLLLPETLGFNLPDTLEEGEQFGKGAGLKLCCAGNTDKDDDKTVKSPAEYAALPTEGNSPNDDVMV
ncbi:organic cation transporter protein-like [Asterias amurensis]|uniref:organic cation transporter protein-like n=1 Tax=Asterias amurensis TaxID=7602 RepID=UPI003AB68D6B